MSKFKAVLSKQSTARGKADYLQFLADIEAAKETRPELEDMETITAADVGIVNTRHPVDTCPTIQMSCQNELLSAPKGSSRHPVDTWSTDLDGARKHAERHTIYRGPTDWRGDYIDGTEGYDGDSDGESVY